MLPTPSTSNKSVTEKVDVIVLGAGASGLRVAAKLVAMGLNVLIFEARDRVGGRIMTSRTSRLSCPIELGAEFIHGTPRETFEIVAAAGLSAYDVLDKHDRVTHGQLSEVDFFENVESLMERLDPEIQKDRSFADFLLEQGKDFAPETRALAKAYIEGFQAAATEEISEQSLAETSEDNHETENAAQLNANYRLFDGYEKLIQHLQNQIPNSSIHLSSCATKLEWSPKAVTVEIRSLLNGDSRLYSARRVVVTLPLGVLKSSFVELGHLEILPMPETLAQAIAGLRMGPAVRITLEFKSRFWELLFDEPIGYLHGSQELAFPTWWTSLPLHSPILTAWAGGPKAQKLEGKSTAELTQIALDSLVKLIGPMKMSAEKIRAEFVKAYHHDWLSDPFSRGSYSFAGVGGVAPARRLRESFDDTLFFAGEHTEVGEARGTVHGALASADRVATQIHARLRS